MNDQENIPSSEALEEEQQQDQQSSAGGEPAADSAEQLAQELADMRDRALRAQADLDNYRKRAQREMDETRRYAAMPLLRDLLPLADNMRLAIEAAEKSPDSGALLEGFKMVSGQLQQVLAQHECKQIEALGQPFDPDLHEAAGSQADPDHPPGTVIYVLREGYVLGDRVVRPANVMVSAGPPQGE